MADESSDPGSLDRFLDQVYAQRQRCSRGEIRQAAERAGAPSALLARIDALPGGEFTRDELAAALPAEDAGVWRDPSRTPLADLHDALGDKYAGEGQVDDVTGEEAGAEAEFGDAAVPGPPARDRDTDREPDPDTVHGRRLRPSPEGRSGPS